MSEIVFNAPTTTKDLQSQVENLQTTLASLNQQVIILQETLQERDQKIIGLQTKLTETTPGEAKTGNYTDDTLTVVGVLIKLYQFLFPPGKDAAASIN